MEIEKEENHDENLDDIYEMIKEDMDDD